MSIFRKLFKNRKQPVASNNDTQVILKTQKNLSENQKSTIITIVKKGIISGAHNSDIVIDIMVSTGIYEVIILTRIENRVEVII